MTIQLPDPINTFFEVSNGKGLERVKTCFTDNAVVLDEGGTYEGLAAIEAWVHDTRQKYQFSVKPLSITKKDSHDRVVAEVNGNFPGSPVNLDYDFALAADKIQSLEIS